MPRDPFSVTLSKPRQDDLISMLQYEIQSERAARSSIIDPNGDLDYYRLLYEGGDRTLTKNFPWPGAANLTSYLGTESVDAMRARIVQTIFTDPIWIVDGWDDAAERAPLVEEFHQWKAEEERLQRYMTRVVQTSLLEGTGILEVFERPLKRRVTQKMRVRVQLDPITRGMRVDERGRPMPEMDDFGDYVEPEDDTTPQMEILSNRLTSLRHGPQYRVISLRDFLFLPGTAQDPSDVWGYAKRVRRRVGDLRADAVRGYYDKQAIRDIGEEDESEDIAHLARTGQHTASRLPGAQAIKILHEVSLLLDLDRDGLEEWYLCTLHLEKGVILRLQRDDLNLSRFLAFTPFPRDDSPYGYTLIEKIASIIEEHTALRNAIADRSTLANAAPITRVHGSPWNPFLVPWGPLAIMDVRDHNDVKQLQISDVPGSMVQREQSVIAAKERVMGLSDSSLGVHPQVDRTFGEVQLVNIQSAVRVDEIIKNIQETMEDLFQVRHTIWQRTYEQEERGEPIPQSVLSGIEERGLSVPAGRMTASMLRGPFRGKPRGSVDTADLTRMRGDYNGFLQAMGMLAQNSPAIGQVLGMPEVIRMILTQAMRVYRWQDRHSLNLALQKMTQAITQSANQPQLPPNAIEGEVAGPNLPGLPPAPAGMEVPNLR